MEPGDCRHEFDLEVQHLSQWVAVRLGRNSAQHCWLYQLDDHLDGHDHRNHGSVLVFLFDVLGQNSVTVTGTLSGSGTITGYASGNVYHVIGTGTNSFTLDIPGWDPNYSIATTAGSTTGLTFTVTRFTVNSVSGGLEQQQHL